MFGASGVVGRALLPLLRAEHEIVAVSRSPTADEPGVRWLQGDAGSAADAARAVEGATTVYYLVHSLGRTISQRIDREAAENVAAACETAGVRQIVYLGGLGDDAVNASPHLRSRHETGERLAAGSVPVTSLRAAIVVGQGARRSRRPSRSSTGSRR